MDCSLISVGLSGRPLELAGPGPFICPLLHHLWILDCLTSDIFFIFFSCDCSAFSAVIIMSAAVFYMIVFLLLLADRTIGRAYGTVCRLSVCRLSVVCL